MKKETKINSSNEDLKEMFKPLLNFLGCKNMEINDDGYSITFTQRKENKQNAYDDKNEELREIKTPIGTIYIEHFSYREEDERIKIYDSKRRYLDYISMDTIMDWSEEYHCSCVTIFEEYIKYLEKCSTVEKLFEGLGINYVKYSVEWKVVADKLVEDSEHQINSVIELLDNDFVNQIGDYYIYISEN